MSQLGVRWCGQQRPVGNGTLGAGEHAGQNLKGRYVLVRHPKPQIDRERFLLGNAYADTNSFVVLYPQATPDPAFGKPKGCWDWWGYLGPGDADYATRRGPQMATVMNMVSALGG